MEYWSLKGAIKFGVIGTFVGAVAMPIISLFPPKNPFYEGKMMDPVSAIGVGAVAGGMLAFWMGGDEAARQNLRKKVGTLSEN